jgi:AdoMet-dependent heme synthase
MPGLRNPWTRHARRVHWRITNGCNLRCIHCHGSAADLMSPSDPSYVECCRTIDRIAELAPAILVLGGGEPLWRRDVFDIVRRAAEVGLEVELATNGTLVDEAMSERIRDSGAIRVSVSLDGADAATHDTFRGHQGAFAAAVRGIKLMIQLGIGTAIRTTVSRHNAHQLPGVLALAEGLGVRVVHLLFRSPVDCGLTPPPEDAIQSDEVDQVLQPLYNRSLESGLALVTTCDPRNIRVSYPRQGKLVFEDWRESQNRPAAEPFSIFESRNPNADHYAS